MKRNTLVAGVILALSLAADCGSKAPASTEAPVSKTETSVSVSSEASTSQEEVSTETAEAEEPETAPVKKAEPKESPLQKTYAKYNSAGELIHKIDYDDAGHPTYEYDNRS